MLEGTAVLWEEFQPTRPLRGATKQLGISPDDVKFQPTRPLRGATRPSSVPASRPNRRFQPTRPLRGATSVDSGPSFASEFQPTRPLRGATVLGRRRLDHLPPISTHAPLAGRDFLRLSRGLSGGNFNPRAPCGARRDCAGSSEPSILFQPTRPLRGATPSRSSWTARAARFQPTRPLRGATAAHALGLALFEISTHAPLAGRDNGKAYDWGDVDLFQPTRPLRGATGLRSAGQRLHRISTHAPLAGRDQRDEKENWPTSQISTHAPLAGRDRRLSASLAGLLTISTHAPLAGRDINGATIDLN